MAVGKTLTVYLAADVGRLSRGLNSAETDVRTFGSTIDGMGNRLTSMLGPALIGAGIAAGALAVKLGTEGVQAALEDDAAASKLATTLGNLGLAHDVKPVEAMIDSLARETGVADDALRPAFDRLVRSIGNTKDATAALRLSMDISAGSGKSLDAVVQALGKAYDGNTAGLSKLGAGIDSTILKTGDMAQITAALSSTFAGQASTAAQTYQGQVNRLKVGFDELKESFGAGFLEGLGNTEQGVDDLAAKMKALEPQVKALGSTAGNTAVAVTGMAGDLVMAADSAKNLADGPSWDGLIAHLKNTARSAQDFKNVVNKAPAVGPFIGSLIDLTNAWIGLDTASSRAMANGAMEPTAGTGGDFGAPTPAPTPTAGRDWIAFYQGNQAAQESLAKATAKNDELLKEYLKSLDGTSNASGRTAVATEMVSAKFTAQVEASRGLIEQLDAQIAKVGALRAEQDAYSKSVKSTLTGSLSLEGAWSAASDALGANASSAEIAAKAIELFKQQIADTKAFAESWRSIANEAGAGGQGVIDQLGGVFTAHGKTPGIALATAIHDEGLAPTLAADLTAFDVFAGDVGKAFGSKFYDEGINDAEKVLEGMADKIAKSNKALNRMGRDIGTPIGIAIQAEIEDAIARATKEAATARARAAENARAADAAAATTPASAGASILRVIANTNARSGYTGANASVFGVLV